MRNSVRALLAIAHFAIAQPPTFGAAVEPHWGIQLAGSHSEATARRAYQALREKYPDLLAGRTPEIVRGVMVGGGPGAFYTVVLPASSRGEADDFCSKLEAAGGACVVGRTTRASE